MIRDSRLPATLALLLIVVLFVFSLAPRAVAARDEKSVRVGESWVIELQGNPSTGYKWRLNEGASENLAIVKVEDLGYGEPAPSDKKLVGRPAPYRFRLTTLLPGSARLHFEYVQPWVGKPEETEDIWVRVD